MEEALKIVISLDRIGYSTDPIVPVTPILQPLPSAKVVFTVSVGGVVQSVIVKDETEIIEIPDDLTGVEQAGQMDIIARLLNDDPANSFRATVTKAPVVYVN